MINVFKNLYGREELRGRDRLPRPWQRTTQPEDRLRDGRVQPDESDSPAACSEPGVAGCSPGAVREGVDVPRKVKRSLLEHFVDSYGKALGKIHDPEGAVALNVEERKLTWNEPPIPKTRVPF